MVGNASEGAWMTSSSGGTVTDDNSLPLDPNEDWLHRIDEHSPHETGAFRLRWNGTSDRLRFSLGMARDLRGFGFLSFRIGQAVDTTQNPDGPLDLDVALRDAHGNDRQVRVSAFAEIPRPAFRTDTIVWQQVTKSAMRTVRIPLGAFRIAIDGADNIDLASVQEIAFRFAAQSTGEILLDEVGFADGSLPPDDIVPSVFVPNPSLIGADVLASTSVLPEAPDSATDIAAMRWRAREVVRVLDGRPSILQRIEISGVRLEVRAFEPVVRAGSKDALFTETSRDGASLFAYFDDPIDDGVVIDLGYEDRGLLYRAPERFRRASLERLDRAHLPGDLKDVDCRGG
jgi:hypothetical protein